MRDVLLETVKDKLVRNLHLSLKGWNVDFVNDIVDAVIEDDKDAIDELIKRKE
jgi:hypothetical protein